MTTADALPKILQMSQPVLAAYACVLAIVVGGAIGLGIAGVASAAGIAQQSHVSDLVAPESQTP